MFLSITGVLAVFLQRMNLHLLSQGPIAQNWACCYGELQFYLEATRPQ